MTDGIKHELGFIYKILSTGLDTIERNFDEYTVILSQLAQAQYAGSLDLSDEFNADLFRNIRSRTCELLGVMWDKDPESTLDVISNVTDYVFPDKGHTNPVCLGGVDFAAKVANSRHGCVDNRDYIDAWRIAVIAASVNIRSEYLDDSIKQEEAKPRPRTGFLLSDSMPRILSVYAPELQLDNPDIEMAYYAAEFLIGMSNENAVTADAEDRVGKRMSRSLNMQIKSHAKRCLAKFLPELAKVDPEAAFDYAADVIESVSYDYLDGACPLGRGDEYMNAERNMAKWLYTNANAYLDDKFEAVRNEYDSFEDRVKAYVPLHKSRMGWFAAAMSHPWSANNWIPMVESAAKVDESMAFFANIHNRAAIANDDVMGASENTLKAVGQIYRLFGYPQAHNKGRDIIGKISVKNLEDHVPSVGDASPAACEALIKAIMHVHASDAKCFMKAPLSEELQAIEQEAFYRLMTHDEESAIALLVGQTMEALDRSYSNPVYLAVAENRGTWLARIFAEYAHPDAMMEHARDAVRDYEMRTGKTSCHAKSFGKLIGEARSASDVKNGVAPK